MAGALAADRDLVGKLGLEQDQRLGIEAAILDEAERQRVDAGAPGQSAGLAPVETMALAKRAPSMCKPSPCDRASSPRAATSAAL